MGETELYNYAIELEVIDYMQKDGKNLTLKTNYVLPHYDLNSTAPSSVVKEMEDGQNVAFEITSSDEDELGEFNSIYVKVGSISVGNNHENEFEAVVYGEIVLFDGVQESPPMAQNHNASIYDDILEIGFEPISAEAMLVENEDEMYDILVNGVPGLNE